MCTQKLWFTSGWIVCKILLLLRKCSGPGKISLLSSRVGVRNKTLLIYAAVTQYNRCIFKVLPWIWKTTEYPQHQTPKRWRLRNVTSLKFTYGGLESRIDSLWHQNWSYKHILFNYICIINIGVKPYIQLASETVILKHMSHLSVIFIKKQRDIS